MNAIRMTIRFFKFTYQKIKRGFNDSETWNLDWETAAFLAKRLKRFKTVNNGYPNNLTDKEWDLILGEMIDGFEAYSRYDIFIREEETEKKIDRSLELLSKYFRDLWW